tara:strand:- start:30841 stop:31227 length:387 start_codon:yes stop_codon:yes gene_type:complete
MANNENYDRRLEQINEQLAAHSTKLDTKFDHLSNKIELMASSISELAQVIAKKEVSDHHMKEQLMEARQEIKDHATNTKTELTNLKSDVANLKLVSAGDNTMRRVFWAVLSLLVLGVGGALIKLVLVK